MIVIPIKPISTNQLFQGRRFKTAKYDEFIQAAMYLMPKIPMVKGMIRIRVNFYVKHDKTSDLDNFLKGFLDLIVKKGYIEDDRFIYQLYVKKFNSDYERIELKVQPLGPKKIIEHSLKY